MSLYSWPVHEGVEMLCDMQTFFGKCDASQRVDVIAGGMPEGLQGNILLPY